MIQIFPIRPAWRRYAAALLLITVAAVVRMWLTPYLGARGAYLTFYPAVTLAALLGGRGPGLLAMGLSLGMVFFWFEPLRTGLRQDALIGIATAVFFLCSIAVTLIADAMHRVYERLQREIEERKRIEGSFAEARDAAEAANKAKDRFLATLSHELRTPLTPALLIADAMERSSGLPPEVHADVATIASNIKLQARIIDDLLDMTRITQDKLQLDLQPCDAHSLLRCAEKIVANDLKTKALNLTNEFHAAEFHVHADPVRLQQVFWNVLKNAIKFTPCGGSITLRSSNEDHMWHLAISDTGIGIRSEDLPKIFDAFAQCGQATDPHFGGLGLGLTISGRLMHKQGGRIWAESRGIKQGSTFHIEVPVSTAKAEQPTPVVVPDAPCRQLRILLVEDHEATRQTLVRLLARRGHSVSAAGTVAEARALAHSHEFDLLLSDVSLPDGDGRTLMKELHHELQLRGIALSGYGMEADVQQSLEAGFQEHLTKPVDLPTLERAIARVSTASIDQPV